MAMTSSSLLASDIAYFRNLIKAGLNGITSARNETTGGIFTPRWKSAAWTPALVGAALGALSTCFGKGRRSVPRAAMGGLVGSALGFGGGVAWASRGFTGTAARHAIRGVNNVRDARWLERNPIDYA
jgi:hypothetical protein